MANFRRIKRSPELQAKLTALRKTVHPGVQEGLLKAGDVIVAEQKRLAPVDAGKLKASLKRELTQSARTGNQAVKVSTDVFYAPFVEFGTKNARARPFFFPAYRAQRRRARAIIGKAIRETILKAVK